MLFHKLGWSLRCNHLLGSASYRCMSCCMLANIGSEPCLCPLGYIAEVCVWTDTLALLKQTKGWPVTQSKSNMQYRSLYAHQGSMLQSLESPLSRQDCLLHLFHVEGSVSPDCGTPHLGRGPRSQHSADASGTHQSPVHCSSAPAQLPSEAPT